MAQKTVEIELATAPEMLPLLPLKNVIILPKSILPIMVARASSISAVEEALKRDKIIFITTQKDPEVNNPSSEDVFAYGTKSTIVQITRMPNGSLKMLAEGLSRAKMVTTEQGEGFMYAHCIEIPSTGLELTTELQALWRHLKSLYETYARLNEKAPSDLMSLPKTVEDMDTIADTLAVHLNLSFFERQEILEIGNLPDRLVKLSKFLTQEIDILETEHRIRGRIQTQVEKNQREYYLTEQIKAIQKELGREDHQVEVNEIRAKLKGLGLSEEAHEKAEKELKRLEQMPPMSAEAVVSRTYIDWIISLPWKKQSNDNISIQDAEKFLDAHHAGLIKAKERIIEFLAAKKFSKTLTRSPIVCLVGPPGVGKTSLAESIAKGLNREFVRISLGGLGDEAEIRGHRRTYIGALPGKIIQAMRKAKTVNPVILLDEIDKMSRDMRGDPAAALLEVLDPEQNKAFTDHFMELDYDLSKVMFVATANMIDTIPFPLFDRMEIISLSGYTDAEKLEIGRKFLIPRGLKEYGLKATQFIISDTLLQNIVTQYTREAGVRQLERIIHKLMRKTIQQLLLDKATKQVTITEQLLTEWLGHAKFKKTNVDLTQKRIGLATGLAWTEFGGDILDIEATVLPGKGGLTLTGQLGEVMQESAQAALSYIRSRAKDLHIKESFYSNKDLHIHIPEGATPKDGPSAGITMCVAAISALTKNPTRPDIAMTGEITLRGRVLAVGGLKEKLLAAKQYGMRTALVPLENKDDIADVAKELPADLEIIFVDTMDQVLQKTLMNDPFVAPKNGRKHEAEKKAAKKSTSRKKK
ncbi:MAG: endopeptidase La [Candidatus Babeliales bacterium]